MSGTSFCWHCSKQLMRKKGGFRFSTVVDRDGIEHRVHKDCVQFVIGDGVRGIGDAAKVREYAPGITDSDKQRLISLGLVEP